MRLPTGEPASDVSEYGKAWKELAVKCEKYFEGYEWTGFDPFIRLERKDRHLPENRYTCVHVDIPAHAALALTRTS